MILDVGIGDTGEAITTASIVHLGEERDPRRRAELLDEGLEIIAGLWSGEPFSFEGNHFRVEELTFRPLPVQKPRTRVGSVTDGAGPKTALTWCFSSGWFGSLPLVSRPHAGS